MSPVAFLDANVPMYAAGRDHPLKEPCRAIVLHAGQRPDAFLTDAEVLQELLHRYLALRVWPQGRESFLRFAQIMEGRTEDVQARDVQRAAELADTVNLGGRDLLHAAVMERLGLRLIVSADAGFDRLPQLERLDPARWPAWRGLLGL